MHMTSIDAPRPASSTSTSTSTVQTGRGSGGVEGLGSRLAHLQRQVHNLHTEHTSLTVKFEIAKFLVQLFRLSVCVCPSLFPQAMSLSTQWLFVLA